jgi:putative serine protease PepD
MTAGFAGSGPVGPAGERAADEPDHPGPLPPRIDRPVAPGTTGSLPTVPGPVVGAGGHPTGSWATTPPSGFPLPPSVPPVPPPVGLAPRRRPVLALLVALLALLVVAQGAYLVALAVQLDSANRKIDSLTAADDKRISGLDARTRTLEQQAAKSLDASAVSAAILPSVFRIDVDEGSATAFAIHKAANGGTDLLTNFHVVSGMWKRGERTVSVSHDSQRFPVRIVQVDEDNDLALLHADQNFPTIKAAPTAVTPGTPIVLIGAPLGLAQSVTTGVVSAVRDDIPGDAGRTYIQFDAAINPGNSGGPVVDAQKQVVGVASSKVKAEGIGLAIPISVACHSFSGIC